MTIAGTPLVLALHIAAIDDQVEVASPLAMRLLPIADPELTHTALWLPWAHEAWLQLTPWPAMMAHRARTLRCLNA